MPKVRDATPEPGLPRPGVQDLPLRAGEIARYEGTYTLDAGGRRLAARIYGDADTDSRIVFAVEEDRARALTLHLGGAVIPGVRAPQAREVADTPSADVSCAIASSLERTMNTATKRGEVRLDDPVARYLPGHVTVPTPGGYEITLGDLATHRSGLPPGPRNPHGDLTVEDLYDLVAVADLERPGRRYAFSHLGYGLLGHALARAAGASYVDPLRERVLDPLGMERTGYALEGRVEEWMVHGRGHRPGAEPRGVVQARAVPIDS